LAQEILDMNQANMSEANDVARRRAAGAHQRMVIAIILCAAIALPLSFMTHRWILRPIHKLIESANDIRRGNLDLVVPVDSRDEIGELSSAFNSMAAALREARRTDQIDLMRTRRATEEVFKTLPAAVAVLDLNGRVEVSTETAARHFGLKPGVLAKELGFDWLNDLVRRAMTKGSTAELEAEDGHIQQFVENREYFFQPVATPIRAQPGRGEPTGTALILRDVTQVHEQHELKRNVIATVSHQLKTPLTSLRMSIHLLLEEKIGALNAKQAELLVGAREDSERLAHILGDLLDLNRIESGKALLDVKPVSPRVLVRDATEPFLVESRDKGVPIHDTVPDDLPDVLADSAKINQVFANLLSNALRFTKPGGSIAVDAQAEREVVRFSVRDTGKGIPAKHVDRVFDQFYRVPGHDGEAGVGLGLAIVRQIVVAHGGEAGVESEVGKGSSFWFTLPRAGTGKG
ncbi:MAG: multi-sensor signal transduction histidine kinase, partial [Candidatus Krumholzibacteriota bacterium]|nr:multi-sensor signal transduction histidine kinase [Candidatus Krumholzibacteriota bacterium]